MSFESAGWAEKEFTFLLKFKIDYQKGGGYNKEGG